MPRKLFRCSADSAPRVSAPLVAGAAPFTCDGDADMWVGFCATTAAVAAKSSSVVSCDTFVIVTSSVRLAANGIAASRGKTAQAARRSHAEQTRRCSLRRRVSGVIECRCYCVRVPPMRVLVRCTALLVAVASPVAAQSPRSEEHTSELQSPCNLVCRLLLEKKKKKNNTTHLTQITIRNQNPHTR